MDEYPQGGQSTYAETYMFWNLGCLCKTLHFQFLSVLMHTTSHLPHLEAILHANNSYLSEAKANGFVTVWPSNKPSFTVPVTL
ncbi:uncharacterized protein ACA1_362460 [Acanthamoeba castellanii str. Neff]|uniref:Uncharacterized protein n=1 Tax=Acanthamoeba castellanii (strain ATCC 30010 / Neff) TaxID=1257118 RepID=L8GFI5_ACACF|nr:uncharacterized protein ACA1_362460 [Acanthamoeba castellanii str. Neff]ELR11762.1 hypothetical protein ACA1_362460 [Acanthamoeba castellanii str. Neff]